MTLNYDQLLQSAKRLERERDELREALRELLAYSVGNREDRIGNPYLRPSIKTALTVLYTADNGVSPVGTNYLHTRLEP